MRHSKLSLTIFFGLVVCVSAYAQMPDCTLGIGGKDTEVIEKVFQLNEEQKTKIDVWIGQLQAENKLREDEIKQLFDTHPQGTHEELETLAKKYKVLKDKMVAASMEYDRKLLGIFNEKQYERYVQLCNEALRRPMAPAEISVDTIPE